MKKQVFNPYLPLNEYVPDAEPHVFGDRVYIYGSHDKEGGDTFCMLDYVVYSAPVNDLSDWKCEGIIYKASQDPDYGKDGRIYMYAPDAVRGNDGKYYLYYCLSGKFGKGGYFGPISVAVCDTPAGKYEYLGFVKNPDGTPMKKYVCFDPAVINDDGIIRIYYGTQMPYEQDYDSFINNNELIEQEMNMFGKSREEILGTTDSVMGACTVTVNDDMLTICDEPRHIIPYRTKDTDFDAHPFFEASSMRKVNGKYYFIYSSMQNHELCYAVSNYPDRDFSFGGTIVSNGDVGLNGRTENQRLNMTGTTHGSIEKINNQWYVFYHRLTHKSDYSRQACAEKINIENDGSIKQVEITSCGLNGKPLEADRTYPAVIACNITNGNMPHGSNKIYTESFPNVTHSDDERFIGEICNNTLIGYKYFNFKDSDMLGIKFRGNANGKISVFTNTEKQSVAEFIINPSEKWNNVFEKINIPDGIYPLYFIFKGTGKMDLKEISFINNVKENNLMNYKYESNRIYSENTEGKIIAEITFPETEKGTFCIDHTFVDDSLRGQGIASKLMNMAVEKIKQQNGKITATCSYAAHWLEKNKI